MLEIEVTKVNSKYQYFYKDKAGFKTIGKDIPNIKQLKKVIEEKISKLPISKYKLNFKYSLIFKK